MLIDVLALLSGAIWVSLTTFYSKNWSLLHKNFTTN